MFYRLVNSLIVDAFANGECDLQLPRVVSRHMYIWLLGCNE